MKAPANIKSLARKHTTEALERLAHWMRSDEPRASVAACIALLDRGWGKPSQPVTGADEQPIQFENVSARDELNRRIAALATRAGKAEDPRRLN